VLHLPCQFRNELDPGAYPCPFWHSQKKWESYERAVELLLVIENGKIIGAYRSAEQDPVRSHVMYPNQALTMRHEIVRRLEQNSMPPRSGIADPAERKKLLTLARQFAAMGDKALHRKQDLKP
jgi:hypothetical protein